MIKKKAAIVNALLKNTSAQGTIGNDNVDIDFKITAPDENDGDDDVTYVKYIPPPPENPPPLIHPRERCKQKLKQIREQKERYRRNAKKKVIKFLKNRSTQKKKRLVKKKKKKNSRTKRR